MKADEGLRMLRCTVENSKKQNLSALFGWINARTVLFSADVSASE